MRTNDELIHLAIEKYNSGHPSPRTIAVEGCSVERSHETPSHVSLCDATGREVDAFELVYTGGVEAIGDAIIGDATATRIVTEAIAFARAEAQRTGRGWREPTVADSCFDSGFGVIDFDRATIIERIHFLLDFDSLDATFSSVEWREP